MLEANVEKGSRLGYTEVVAVFRNVSDTELILSRQVIRQHAKVVI